MSDEIKKYTLEAISKNNGENGARTWIILKDIVYDVTDYLEDHPGGGSLITEWAGKDATKAFEDFGHSADAKKELKQYKIGEVVDEERKGKKGTAVDKKKEIESSKGPQVKICSMSNAQRKSCIAIITCGMCG